MRGIARRLDRDASEIESGGQRSGANQPFNTNLNFIEEIIEKIHVVFA